MKIIKEKAVKYIEMDFELSMEEQQQLISYALEHIVFDNKELINYAIVKLLADYVENHKVDKAVKDISKFVDGYIKKNKINKETIMRRYF